MNNWEIYTTVEKKTWKWRDTRVCRGIWSMSSNGAIFHMIMSWSVFAWSPNMTKRGCEDLGVSLAKCGQWWSSFNTANSFQSFWLGTHVTQTLRDCIYHMLRNAQHIQLCLHWKKKYRGCIWYDYWYAHLDKSTSCTVITTTLTFLELRLNNITKRSILDDLRYGRALVPTKRFTSKDSSAALLWNRGLTGEHLSQLHTWNIPAKHPVAPAVPVASSPKTSEPKQGCAQVPRP